jgi:hypothetical protein
MEAWLLDDPVAVREALMFPAQAAVSSVRESHRPKDTLNALWEQSPRKQSEAGEPVTHVLGDIAEHLDPKRCTHRRETGFQSFATDVRRELGTLTGD